MAFVVEYHEETAAPIDCVATQLNPGRLCPMRPGGLQEAAKGAAGRFKEWKETLTVFTIQ
jgi:hypothetical protein